MVKRSLVIPLLLAATVAHAQIGSFWNIGFGKKRGDAAEPLTWREGVVSAYSFENHPFDSVGTNDLHEVGLVSYTVGMITNGIVANSNAFHFARTNTIPWNFSGTNSWTVGFWFSLGAGGQYNEFVALDRVSGGAGDSVVSIYHDGFNFKVSELGPGGFNNTGIGHDFSEWEFDTWYLGVVSYDAGSDVMRLWVGTNAVEQSSVVTTNADSAVYLRVGSVPHPYPGEYILDELMFWDRVLTTNEVVQLWDDGTGRTAPSALSDQYQLHLTLDDGADTNAFDSGPQGMIGNLVGGPTWETGRVGNYSVNFDGVNDYIRITNNAALNVGSGSFSVAFWLMKTNDTCVVLGQMDGSFSGPGWNARFFSADVFQVGIDDGPTAANPRWTVATPSEWHHYAITVDRTVAQGVKFYLDGVEQSCGANCTYDLTSMGSLDNALYFGLATRSPNNNGSYFGGAMDDVFFYKRVLSEDEVRRLVSRRATP